MSFEFLKLVLFNCVTEDHRRTECCKCMILNSLYCPLWTVNLVCGLAMPVH